MGTLSEAEPETRCGAGGRLTHCGGDTARLRQWATISQSVSDLHFILRRPRCLSWRPQACALPRIILRLGQRVRDGMGPPSPIPSTEFGGRRQSERWMASAQVVGRSMEHGKLDWPGASPTSGFDGWERVRIRSAFAFLYRVAQLLEFPRQWVARSSMTSFMSSILSGPSRSSSGRSSSSRVVVSQMVVCSRLICPQP